MRRIRNDPSYKFRPPAPRDWLRPLGLALDRAVHLERKYRIGKIETEGFRRFSELNEAGNVQAHPTHLCETLLVRLYVWMKDGNGDAATANMPFKVL